MKGRTLISITNAAVRVIATAITKRGIFSDINDITDDMDVYVGDTYITFSYENDDCAATANGHYVYGVNQNIIDVSWDVDITIG